MTAKLLRAYFCFLLGFIVVWLLVEVDYFYPYVNISLEVHVSGNLGGSDSYKIFFL